MQEHYKTWQNSQLPIPLAENELHLWCLELNSSSSNLDQVLTILSQDELQRGGRLINSVLKRRFWLAHGVLRLLLAKYLMLLPRCLSFRYGPHGKPYLIDSENIQFNLSHSQNRMLLAVTKGSEIGVDIEQMQPKSDFLKIAQRFFSSQEYDCLYSLPSAEQSRAFYEIWTRKEAFLKAHGCGLSRSLGDFIVLNQSNPRVNWRTAAESMVDVQGCYIYSFSAVDDFARACATFTKVSSITYWSTELASILI